MFWLFFSGCPFQARCADTVIGPSPILSGRQAFDAAVPSIPSSPVIIDELNTSGRRTSWQRIGYTLSLLSLDNSGSINTLKIPNSLQNAVPRLQDLAFTLALTPT